MLYALINYLIVRARLEDAQAAAEGAPAEIVDAAMVERVFGLGCRVVEDPETGTPLVIPGAPRTASQRSSAGRMPSSA